jgi:hypothetical protein
VEPEQHRSVDVVHENLRLVFRGQLRGLPGFCGVHVNEMTIELQPQKLHLLHVRNSDLVAPE